MKIIKLAPKRPEIRRGAAFCGRDEREARLKVKNFVDAETGQIDDT